MTLEKIKAEIERMEYVMHKYRDFGARDTEPDYVFQSIITHAIYGESGDIWGKNADEWELYTATMNCEAAAVSLSGQAKKVVEAIREVIPPCAGDFKKTKNFLMDYCWRIRRMDY